ncbi:uncharacterized protein LOC117592502 [Drosophila guanche]|uniref:Chorion protein S38 n=1 Tax=Drosophila guanche TaxID=7266 RepID=A0A3B0J3W9_DROGU|nr:uncharacterized protein LOC117592502 [Drosophila guanche]SPP74063.1 Hypothetical predicted protein [Drosophila guanche]
MDPRKSYLLLLATAVFLTVCALATSTPTLGKSKEIALKPINLPDPSQLLSTLSSKLVKPKPALPDPKQLLAGLSSKFVKPKPVFVKPVIVKPVVVIKPVVVGGGSGGGGHGHGHHGHHGKKKFF